MYTIHYTLQLLSYREHVDGHVLHTLSWLQTRAVRWMNLRVDLAVEMLGLATGLLASPGSRVFFYFFVIPNKIHNNENEQWCFLSICFISNKYKHIYIKSIQTFSLVWQKNKLWSTHHQLQMLSHQLEICVIRNIKYNKDWYTKRLHFNSIEKLLQFSLAFWRKKI